MLRFGFLKSRDTLYYWKCNVGKDNKYFYGIFDDAGLVIMEFNDRPYDMKVLSIIKQEIRYDIDFMTVSPDEKLVIVGISLNKAVLSGNSRKLFKLK